MAVYVDILHEIGWFRGLVLKRGSQCPTASLTQHNLKYADNAISACRGRLPPYKVFIAYKGSPYCTRVARFVDKCIWQNQMIPHIALKGTKGQISYTDENDILGDIDDCDAFVAVNAKGPNRHKFKTECNWAFDTEKPMVAMIQKGSHPIRILKRKSEQYVLPFKKWRSAECTELVEGIKMIVKASRPPRHVPEGQALRRRTL